MSPVDKAREEYAALRAALAPRNHVTHHTDCGCFTIAADVLIAALEAEVKELDDKLMEAEAAHENARRWFEEQKKQFARAEQLQERVNELEAKCDDCLPKYGAYEQRAEQAEADLAAAREEARHMQGDALVIREVAERITKEGTDAPLDPMWLYERMCEVIEVIDSGYLLARYQPEEDV